MWLNDSDEAQARLKKDYDEYMEAYKKYKSYFFHPDNMCVYKYSCAHCKKTFYATYHGTAYCSRRCRLDASAIRKQERRLKIREIAQHKVCPVCGIEYQATRKDGVYCSSKCKQKAYRRRVTDKGFNLEG